MDLQRYSPGLPVPARSFIRDLPKQVPAPDLFGRLRARFPSLDLEAHGRELCIQAGGFPHDLDCSGFALGNFALSRLGDGPTARVHDLLVRSLGLRHVSRGEKFVGHALGSAVVATFSINTSVKHFALGYVGDESELEPMWYSKFGPGFPVLIHSIPEIDGAAYGTLDAYYVCEPLRCGLPRWFSDGPDL